MDHLKRLVTSFISGLLIVLGCVANLKIGGVVGGVMFSFALLTIVLFQLDLLTGAFGFYSFELDRLGIVFLGNMLGCFLGGLAFRYSLPDISEAANLVISQRTANGYLANLLLAIPCGMIVTIAIGSSEDSLIPLLIGVPIFVMCGLPHCVADFGYISLSGSYYFAWPMTIIGNYIGCNFYRAYQWESKAQKVQKQTGKKIGFS